MTPQQQKQYKAIGGRLAVVLREHHGQPFTTATLQAIAADLVGARTELLLPLKDLVSRPGFQQLIAKAGSGSGGVELRALLADLEMTFTPALINALEEVLNGFLDLPTADGSTTTQRFAETTPLLGLQTPVMAQQTQPSAPSSHQPSAPPPQPIGPKIARGRAPKHSSTRGINPVAMALGICIAIASAVVAGVAMMNSPWLCTPLGLCLGDGESATAEQTLELARDSAADLERAFSLERFRSAATELERALQSLDFIKTSLTPEQQQQMDMLSSISRRAQATVLREETDQKRLKQAEMAFDAGRQRDGAERGDLIQVATEALESISAGGFAAAEANRLQKEIDLFQIEQSRVPEQRTEPDPPTARFGSEFGLDERSAAQNEPPEQKPLIPVPKTNSDGEWRDERLF